jgi:hypothetical protein
MRSNTARKMKPQESAIMRLVANLIAGAVVALLSPLAMSQESQPVGP